MLFGGNLANELPVARDRAPDRGARLRLHRRRRARRFHSQTTNGFVSLRSPPARPPRIRLLSAITLLPLYPAALAAKMTAELARLSGERFDLGAGDGRRVHGGVRGLRRRSAERVPRLEEALTVIGRLLSEEHVTFAGRFTTLTTSR